MTRAERVVQVRALRAEGLMFREIGERLGIAAQTAHEYFHDPSGGVARARKARNNGTCVDCGAVTRNGGARVPPKRCQRCANLDPRHRRRLSEAHLGRVRWSDEQILAALRGAAVDGRLTTAMYEGAYARAPRGSMPSRPLVCSRFGRWADAVVAAGLVPGHRNRVPRPDRVSERACREAVAACAADIGRPPTVGEYEAWQCGRPGAPCATTVRKRLGPWLGVAVAAFEEGLACAA